ncbi:MAG: ComEC/Rec2 family competence protein [Beijerinckiaceae bacterium]|nr:ComEC/Rec2 family competence protein [Beijerinckiaceae bacterium]
MTRRAPSRASAGVLASPAAAWSHAGFQGRVGSLLGRWVEEERDRRTGFLLLPVAFALGVLAYFAASSEPTLWAGPVLLLFAGTLAIRVDGLLRAIAIALAMMAAGFTAGTWRTAGMAAPMLERAIPVSISGHVEQVDAGPLRHRILLRVTHLADDRAARPQSVPYRVRIGAPGRPTIEAGTHVTLRARLAPPSEPAMPGGYDFRRDSFFRAVGGIGYAIGRIEVTPSRGEPDFSLRFNAFIDRARNAMTDRIAQAIGGEAGALSAALITGKRGLISNETNDVLRASGLYHIVSISGLHMVLAAGVMFWTLRALLALSPALALRYPIKKWAAAGAMLGSIGYCVFSGSEVATERSLIMMLVMLGAILVDRPALALRNVAISALIVLAREPEALLGPSFQMSYAAVAALIAGNDLWRRYRPEPEPELRGRFRPGFLERAGQAMVFAFLGIVATTLLASLATAPFSAWHFHRLNPYGLIGNALAIPLVSLVVMPAGVIGTMLLPFGLDGWVWRVMGEGTRGVLFVAEKVAGIEGAAPPVSKAPGHLFALLVIALLVLVIFRSPLRLLAVPLVLLWAILLKATPLPDLMIAPDGRMALLRDASGSYTLLSPASPSGFTLQQWLPALGDARRPDDPTLRQRARCDRTGCTGTLPDGRNVALSLTPEAARLDCQRAQIIITPVTADAALCGPNRLLLSGESFARLGAQQIHLRDGRIAARDTSLDPRKTRPWRKTPPQMTEEPETGPSATGFPEGPATSPQRPRPPARFEPEEDPALSPQ